MKNLVLPLAVTCILLAACAPRHELTHVVKPKTSAEHEEAYKIAYEAAALYYPNLTETHENVLTPEQRLKFKEMISNDMGKTDQGKCFLQAGAAEDAVSQLEEMFSRSAVRQRIAKRWATLFTVSTLTKAKAYTQDPVVRASVAESAAHPERERGLAQLKRLHEERVISEEQLNQFMEKTSDPELKPFMAITKNSPQEALLEIEKEIKANPQITLKKFMSNKATQMIECSTKE